MPCPPGPLAPGSSPFGCTWAEVLLFDTLRRGSCLQIQWGCCPALAAWQVQVGAPRLSAYGFVQPCPRHAGYFLPGSLSASGCWSCLKSRWRYPCPQCLGTQWRQCTWTPPVCCLCSLESDCWGLRRTEFCQSSIWGSWEAWQWRAGGTAQPMMWDGAGQWLQGPAGTGAPPVRQLCSRVLLSGTVMGGTVWSISELPYRSSFHCLGEELLHSVEMAHHLIHHLIISPLGYTLNILSWASFLILSHVNRLRIFQIFKWCFLF